MRKVVMLGPMPPLVGGMATVLDNLKHSDLNQSNDMTFFDTGKNTPENAGKLSKLWAHTSRYLVFIGLLIRLRPDIVHIHTCSGLTFYLDCIYAHLARLVGAKYILHVHGGRFVEFIQSQSGIKKTFAMASLTKAKNIVALSTQWKQRFEQNLNLSKVKVIVNGVRSPTDFDPSKREKNHILFLGAITKKKGIFDLVSALAHVSAPFHLHIAGNYCSDINEKSLYEFIDSFPNMRNKVSVEGVVSGAQKHQLMQRCDIFCLPSYVEGLPMSVLEAMAYQQAAITSNVGGLPDLIQSGQNGVLVAPDDINGLAEALESLLADESLKLRVSKAGETTYYSAYSLEAISPQINAIYD